MNSSQLTNIILEDGYNSDYIYSMITALFYTPSDGTNKIINSDDVPSATCYIQEYIKSKFIYPIHRNISIESCTVNKFRLFLYNCGWLKNDDIHILNKVELDKFYNFLICKIMNHKMTILQFMPDSNRTKENNLDMIRITDKHLNDTDQSSKVINLSLLLNKWVKTELLDQYLSYKFEELPYLLPIYLDIRDTDTGLNKRYINIMEGINFPDNGDKIQSMLIWELHSMICQTEKGDYYTIIIDHNDNLMIFSDKHVPSNWIINVSNFVAVKKIMREVRFIFYKLQ